MDWAIYALLSAGIFGGNSILAKIIVSRLVNDVRTYYLGNAIMCIPMGITLLLIQPLPPSPSFAAIAFAYVGSVAMGAALMLMWFTMRTEEVSRVLPVTQTFPIFVAILATLFLGETLGLLQYAAILVTVAGAILISARGAPDGRIFISRSFFLLLLASLLFAVCHVLTKEALKEISQWNMVSMNAFGLATAFSTVALRRPFLREIRDIVTKRRVTLGAMLTDNFVAFTALLFSFAALNTGPVSLASTLFATRSLFLFLYTILLSWLLPRLLQEPLGTRVLIVKLTALVLILAGVSGILLGS